MSKMSSGGLAAASSGEIMGDSDKRREPPSKRCTCGVFINVQRRRAGKETCYACESGKSSLDDEIRSKEMHAFYAKR